MPRPLRNSLIVPAVLLSLLAQGCRKHATTARGVPSRQTAKKAARPPAASERREPVPAEPEPVSPPPPAPPAPAPAPARVDPIRELQPPESHNPEPIRSKARVLPAKKLRPTFEDHAGTLPEPPLQTDAGRPRRIVLQVPGSAAFKLETPPLREGETSRVRLLLDPKPLIAASAEDYARKRALPGITDGAPTVVSETMEAELSGRGLSVIPEDESSRKSINPQNSTEWFWNVTAAKPGNASLRLNLSSIVNGEKRQADPFPIHVDQIVAPAARTDAPAPAPRSQFSPLWFLALAPIALIGGWRLLKRKKTVSPHRLVSVEASAAPRDVVRGGEGYVFVSDVLVICHAEEQARAEALCRQIANERYKFNFGLAGFAVSSPRWQSDFNANLETCDAILVALTNDSLGEKWTNWQLERATAAQSRREMPIYVAALDEQVLKVSRTMALLEGFKCLPATPEGQAELRALLADAEPASTRNIRCFISYSHRHRDFANKLCDDLNHAGIRTWMDVDGIPGGSTWKLKIAEAIEACTHVLFVLTAESVKSSQVADEIDWARQKKKTIVPVMEAEVDLPFGLLGTQFVSFTEGYDAGFTRLLKDLSLSGGAKKSAGV